MKRNICKKIQFEAYFFTRNPLKRSKRNLNGFFVQHPKGWRVRFCGPGTNSFIRATLP